MKDIPIDNLLYDVNEKYGISSTDIQQIIREEIIGVDEKYNYQEYIDYLSFYFGLFLVLSLHETFKHYINDQFVIEEILNLLVEKYKFKKEYISDFKKLILFINVGDIGEVYENNKDLFDVSPLGINLILKK